MFKHLYSRIRWLCTFSIIGPQSHPRQFLCGECVADAINSHVLQNPFLLVMFVVALMSPAQCCMGITSLCWMEGSHVSSELVSVAMPVCICWDLRCLGAGDSVMPWIKLGLGAEEALFPPSPTQSRLHAGVTCPVEGDLGEKLETRGAAAWLGSYAAGRRVSRRVLVLQFCLASMRS